MICTRKLICLAIIGMLMVLVCQSFTAAAQNYGDYIEYMGDGAFKFTPHYRMTGDAAINLRSYIDYAHGNNDSQVTSDEVSDYVSMILSRGWIQTQNYELDSNTGYFNKISCVYEGIETDDVNSTEPFNVTEVMTLSMNEGPGIEHTFSFTYMPFFITNQYRNISFEVPEGFEITETSGLENVVMNSNNTLMEARVPVTAQVEISYKEVGAVDMRMVYLGMLIFLLIGGPIIFVITKHKLAVKKAEKAKLERPDCFRTYDSKLYKCNICRFKGECEAMTE